jgi:hypothetical protein
VHDKGYYNKIVEIDKPDCEWILLLLTKWSDSKICLQLRMLFILIETYLLEGIGVINSKIYSALNLSRLLSTSESLRSVHSSGFRLPQDFNKLRPWKNKNRNVSFLWLLFFSRKH